MGFFNSLFKKDKSKSVNKEKAEQTVIKPVIDTIEQDQDVIKVKEKEESI